MKVYVGLNKKGKWKASTDKIRIQKMKYFREADLNQINNKVYILYVYYGFDYYYSNEGTGSIENCEYISTIYHSLSSLKKNEKVWKDLLLEAKASPDDHKIEDKSIYSIDATGLPLSYANVMEGKFYAKIISINVDKTKPQE